MDDDNKNRNKNTITMAKETLRSEAAKKSVSEVLRDLISALLGDPIAAMDFIHEARALPSTIKDGIFLECFEVFLSNAYDYDANKKQFVDKNLDSFVIELARANSNKEEVYKGDLEKLNEYAKRIIKIIDDCGTRQKAYYISCLARAVRAGQIDRNKFFKFCYCIRSLTEEDIIFLKNDISDKLIETDEEYIDDFRSLGLLKDVDGGFVYSKRAYELNKYAISYDEEIQVPNVIQERAMPQHLEIASEEDIHALFKD